MAVIGEDKGEMKSEERGVWEQSAVKPKKREKKSSLLKQIEMRVIF